MADRYSERGHRWDDEERRAHYDARARERDYRRDDRGFMDRAGDELRSWFGDEEAQRRRMQDEREDWRERGRGDWGARGEWGRPRSEWTREPDQRDWSRQWGYIEGRGQGRDFGGGREFGGGPWASGYPGYGSWGRERDWPRPETTGRSEFNRGEWGGQGAGGFGTPWSGGREDWGRVDRDWGRSAGQSQSRESDLTRGPHTGRGPRNYQRSDERIKEDVCERFCEHGQLDASDIDVQVQNGEVTIHGSVNDRWAKRMAEDVAENVFGVKEVHNQLRVTQSTFGQEGQDKRDQQSRGTQRGPWAA